MSNILTAGLTLLFVALLYLFLWFVARAVGSHLISAAPSTPSAVLRVISPAETVGRTYTIDRPLVAGRSQEADITLDDPFASDLHTRFAVKGGRLTVADLGSTNGTFVNDNRITSSVEMDPGDTVRLGETIMEAG